MKKSELLGYNSGGNLNIDSMRNGKCVFHEGVVIDEIINEVIYENRVYIISDL
jgi:hypothetical protein